MTLEKRTININFGQGLDTKTDPFQVKLGKFLSLINTVFSIGGMIKKRYGFPILISSPASDTRAIGTSRNNLITVGKQINVYDPIANNLNQTAVYQTCDINIVPLIRDNDPYASVDSAVSVNGYICIVMSNTDGAYYKVLDASTGTAIVNRTSLSVNGKKPKVVVLGNYFYMVYTLGTSLLFKALPTSNPLLATTNGTITAALSSFVIYDIAINTYIGSAVVAWAATSGFGYQMINSNLSFGFSGAITGTNTGTILYSFATLAVDATDGSWWLIYMTSPSGGVENIAYTKRTAAGGQLIAPTVSYTFDTAGGEMPRTGCGYASQGEVTIFFDSVFRVYNTVGPYIGIVWSTHVTASGVDGPLDVIANNVFIGSRAFLFDKQIVVGVFSAMMAVGGEPPTTNFYSTNFIITSSGKVLAKYAESTCGQWYSGGPWNTTLTGVGRTWPVLCSVSQLNIYYYSAYLIMEQPLIQKALAGTPGFYVNTGVDAIRFTVDNYLIKMAEISGSTCITGGQTWQYDGNNSCELGFHTSPQNLSITTATSGGLIGAGTYYYQAVYQWSDANGNQHRSAPSPIPSPGITTTGSASTVTIVIPSLTMTNKTNVVVKIYRSSLTSPLPREITNVAGVSVPNTPDVPSLAYTDKLDEVALVGASKDILYTSLGQLPNDAVPASYDMTVFKARLFIVPCEDRNSIFFSKPVIAGTPPEFSDLFTIFVNPSISSKVNTGPITGIFPMDDKLIIFKQRAIYYIAGEGPDNDGTDNTFTDPIYVSATIGCISKQSVVITPMGLVFQSDKGLWVLGRDLSTQFIGAAVEKFLLPAQPSGATPLVVSAQTVPNTNEVRFGISNGKMVVFDYFYQQWGEFSGLSHLYSTIYKDRHTLLLPDGETVSQELPGTFMDGTVPVFVQFTTAWVNLSGVQGLERAYFFNVLGQDVTPHSLEVQIAYDYSSDLLQVVNIIPTSQIASTKQGRVFLIKQKCQAFQLSFQEFLQPGTTSTGPSFTISGLDVTVALKKGYPTLPANQSVS